MGNRASLKELEKWYDKEYKERGEDFGVSKSAYYGFPDYLKLPCGCYSSYSPENLKLLDVACGQGYLIEVIRNHYHITCYGTELSNEAIKITKERNIGTTLIRKCPAEQIGFPSEMFDYLTCIGSLEHFSDIDKSLEEMYRVGNKHCKYCILVPNKKSWWNNTTEQQEINETFYSMREWSNIFKKQRFKIDNIYRDEWHIHKPQSKTKKLFNQLTPKRFSHSLVFILSKK